MFGVRIEGIGKAVGSIIIPNHVLEKEIGVADGWIRKATGIESRHYVDFLKGENALTLGADAARKALQDGHVNPEEIDCIIGASGSPLQAIPCAASLFQRALGLESSGIPCFDVNTTCYSFPLALFMAANLIQSDIYKKILIISSDAPSPSLDLTEKEVRVLFGDGAAAVVVSRTEDDENSQIHRFLMRTYSEGADFTQVKGGGTLLHPNDPVCTPSDNAFQMSGKKVFKMAARYMPSFMEELFENSPVDKGNLKYIIPHQTSEHGIVGYRRFGFPEERIASHIKNHGNCIAASVPMLLHDLVQEKKVSRGDALLLIGTSAGLSIGGMLMTY